MYRAEPIFLLAKKARPVAWIRWYDPEHLSIEILPYCDMVSYTTTSPDYYPVMLRSPLDFYYRFQDFQELVLIVKLTLTWANVVNKNEKYSR